MWGFLFGNYFPTILFHLIQNQGLEYLQQPRLCIVRSLNNQTTFYGKLLSYGKYKSTPTGSLLFFGKSRVQCALCDVTICCGLCDVTIDPVLSPRGLCHVNRDVTIFGTGTLSLGSHLYSFSYSFICKSQHIGLHTDLLLQYQNAGCLSKSLSATTLNNNKNKAGVG